MKKLFLSILLLFLFVGFSFAANPLFFTVCELLGDDCAQNYFSNVTVDDDLHIANTSTAHYVGTVYVPPLNECICAVDIYVSGVTGTLTSSFDFYMQVYTVDGNDDLASLVSNGTSAAIQGELLSASTWISANAGRFEFSPAVSLTGSTEYALVVVLDTEGDGVADEPSYSVPDNTNYFDWGYDNGASSDSVLGGRGRWLWDSSIPYADQSTDAGDDVQIKVYTTTCP